MLDCRRIRGCIPGRALQAHRCQHIPRPLSAVDEPMDGTSICNLHPRNHATTTKQSQHPSLILAFFFFMVAVRSLPHVHQLLPQRPCSPG
ncbi:hypothetical protein BDP55DRAFT_647605 [Colletotrichum godetiae]|uniref:Uncharacterized protein n=1 Tax=Colletotrichum godetiae TaxID=1209918 RepID=A0AAJ0AWI3_9PEZI|nr:uncharacterized protein BDP55DRAFT_647605 [Colletotrichum godetiae]KAK1691642.1 hypothetical protein BDP55DRAFT_647605 [Colletotrichum godetiae]